MADASSENSEICNEPRIELEELITSILVKSGMSLQDADTLCCKLKAFSPKYHSMILKYAGFPTELQSTVLSLLEKQDKTERLEEDQNPETCTELSLEEQDIASIDNQSDSLEPVVNEELQKMGKTLTESTVEIKDTVVKPSEEKIEEITTDESNIITNEEITTSTIQEVEEKKPVIKQKISQGYVPLENDIESKKEMQEVLQQIEKSFNKMILEEQEEIIPRYITLKTFLCKEKKEMDSSCIKCLINNSIDCPLFKP
ncbi:MAG: hypothetical protein ACUVXA_06305 [Candidatus Jordarchaeum sp.]|uniref:hypothetical protein n=1 Tax=Candidatus Jordarchaeum sp. TaxID=2823881 RepID=UPI00404994B3